MKQQDRDIGASRMEQGTKFNNISILKGNDWKKEEVAFLLSLEKKKKGRVIKEAEIRSK